MLKTVPTDVLINQSYGKSPTDLDHRWEIRGYLERLSLPFTTRELTKIETTRLAEVHSQAMARFSAVVESFAALSPDDQADLQFIVRGLEAIGAIKEGSKKDSAKHVKASEELLLALNDDVEYAAAITLEDRKRLDLEFERMLPDADSYRVEQAQSARKLFQDACAEDASERDRLFRESRKAFHELAVVGVFGQLPFAWLHVAVASWQLGFSEAEVDGFLAKAMDDPMGQQPLALSLAARLRAQLAAEEGDLVRARSYGEIAVTRWPSAASHYEMAIFCAGTDQISHAEQHLMKAIDGRPTYLLSALAEPRFTSVETIWTGCALRLHRRAKSEALVACNAWGKKASEIEKLLKVVNLSGSVGLNVIQGYDEAAKASENCDYFTLRHIIEHAKSATESVHRQASELIEREFHAKHEALTASRDGADSAHEMREKSRAAAVAKLNQALLPIKQSLEKADQSDHIQRGCMWGGTMSAGLFGLYCLLASIVGGVANEGAFRVIAVIVAAIPASVSAINQISHGAKRMSVKAQAQKSEQELRRRYQAELDEADRAYKDTVSAARDNVSSAESEYETVSDVRKKIAMMG